MFIAEEVRELLARLGFRTLQEAVGHVEALDTTKALAHWKSSKAGKLDLSPILSTPESPFMNQDLYCSGVQDHGLEKALDQQLIAQSREAIDHGTRVSFTSKITNVNRTVGTMLGHEVTKTHGAQGLPEGTIIIDFEGSAGNSFGAFVPKGITLRLEGDANDFVGKGLSGGRIVVRPPASTPEGFVAEDNIIAGNVIGFGATKGKIFLRGVVGERFCVRNSGAVAVVEGVGDHGCEYMTGGRVVVLGDTGRNFAAGMSGGIAYVYDPENKLGTNLNPELVDLEPLDDEDIEFLSGIIGEHRGETASPVAAAILADWENTQQAFAKVMPRDFKRVLAAIDAAEKSGRDVNEAIMEAARG